MSQTNAAEPGHALGFDEFSVETYRRLTAEVHASHLMPHLRPGYRVLDFGCGPGTITVGLAEAVRPNGEAHGVAMIESRVEEARERAAAGGHDNATFHFLNNPTRLPFEDNTFDAAHSQNILMSFPEPLMALGEMRRVLKPGGIISCRELLLEASFSYPDAGRILTRSWEMFTDILGMNFRHADVGKELKWLLLRSGFENVEMSANYDVYSEPGDIEFIYDVFLRWFLSDETMNAAIEQGAATGELRDRIRDYYYEEWRDDPAAMAAMAHGAAIAYKPADGVSSPSPYQVRGSL